MPTEAKPLTLATTLYAKTHQLKPKVNQCHIGRLKAVPDHIGRSKVDHDHIGRPKVDQDYKGRPKIVSYPTLVDHGLFISDIGRPRSLHNSTSQLRVVRESAICL